MNKEIIKEQEEKMLTEKAQKGYIIAYLTGAGALITLSTITTNELGVTTIIATLGGCFLMMAANANMLRKELKQERLKEEKGE